MCQQLPNEFGRFIAEADEPAAEALAHQVQVRG